MMTLSPSRAAMLALLLTAGPALAEPPPPGGAPPAATAGGGARPDHRAAPSHGDAKDAAHGTEKDVKAKDTENKDATVKDSPVRDVQAGDARPQPEPLFIMVRTLQGVQDRMAQGAIEVHGFQRRFIGEIGQKMLSANDETWQESKNVRAAIVYVLSGGDPRILHKLLDYKSLPEVSGALLRGVIAYSEGRNRQAMQYLSEVDHRAFESRLAGHLALAKAMAAAPDDAIKAIAFLDDARLLAPGTLVEEAALRREVLLLSNVEDFGRLEVLASQYLRRFPNSIYAKNFSRSFAIATASTRYSADPLLMKRLEAMLDELNDEMRKQIYMAMAEEGVIRGKVELTRLAADKIGYLLQDGSRDAVRLQLYKAAALVVTKEYDYAVARLRSIDRAKLSANDLELLQSALALAEQMRQPPAVSGPVTELPPLSSATQVKHGAVAEKSEALDSARQALNQVEELLKKERR